MDNYRLCRKEEGKMTGRCCCPTGEGAAWMRGTSLGRTTAWFETVWVRIRGVSQGDGTVRICCRAPDQMKKQAKLSLNNLRKSDSCGGLDPPDI